MSSIGYVQVEVVYTVVVVSHSGRILVVVINGDFRVGTMCCRTYIRC